MKPKSTLRSFLLHAGSTLLAISYTHAATLYWDVNGTADGFSTVVQTWNTTNNFWNTDATGGAAGSVANTTADADDLIIAQALINTGSITVSGTQNASSITFAPNVGPTANITGGTAIVMGGTGASSGIFQQSSGANTISTALTLKSDVPAFNFSNSSTGLLSIANVTGAAAGTQTVTVGSSDTGNINLTGTIANGSGGGTVALDINSSGAGVTTLSGNNSFTGGVTLTAGTLRATQANALGASVGTLTLNGGILDLSNNSGTNFARNTTVGADVTILSDRQIGSLGGAASHTLGTLGIGANTLTVQGGETVTSGTAGITFGATTFSGNTVFNVLPQNAASNTLLTLGNLSDGGSGRTITKNGSGNLTWGTITLSGNHTWAVNGGASATLTSGAITGGSNTLTKTGDGLLILSAANTGSGTYTLEGGVTRLSNTTSLPGGINATGGTSALTLNGGVLELGNGNFLRNLGTGVDQFQITGGASGFSTSGGDRTITVNNTAATVVEWGSATFNPSTFVLNAITAGNNITFSNRLDLKGDGIATARNIAVMKNTATLSGIIENTTNTIGLTKSGAGTLVLSNASNSYNGATTISEGILQANSTGALGSASNSLIFNGGSLKAGGGITSLSTRAVTMTSTGIIDTNNQTVSIAGNIGGAGGLTKSGGNTTNFTGTLTLSGTNNYGGVTTVSGGALQFVNEVSLYNATTGSWTAANINVKSGAGLGLNVGGSGQFSAANLSTLLGNISVANTADQGLQAGATLILDTTNASGGTFTPSSAIADSTGAFGGKINFVKVGSGTLVLGQPSTYTGTTTISAGTIQYDAGISASPLINNGGTLVVNNASGTLTQGSTFHSAMFGTGSINNIGGATIVLNAPNYHTGSTTATAGNITLSHALALQNSALNTTGAGTVTLSGVTTPTFGGLSNSGTTRNLADVITTGYDGVTSLTLNPQSGTATYGGIIANNAANLSLTKNGAGTQELQGANTYAGATTINAGTLTLSGAAGAIASTTININNGGLTLNNATNLGTRISDSAAINVNGNAALTFSHSGTSGVNYSETIGSLALQSGFLTYTGSQAHASTPSPNATSNLSFTTFSRSGTATVNFAGTGLGTNTRNTITFSSGITAGQDIGPWAVVNGADFAYYDSTLGVQTAANTTLAATSNDSAINWKMPAGNIAITGGTSPSYKTLLVSDTTVRTLTTTGNTVSVGGISSTGKEHVISGTGVVQALTAGDALYVNVGTNSLSISSAIQNVGGGGTASALVKSGAGSLLLGSTSNSFTGDIIINGGTLGRVNFGDSAAIYGSGTKIIFAGNGTLDAPNSSAGSTLNKSLTINDGVSANLSFASAAFAANFTGQLLGSGTLNLISSNGTGTFSNADNTFTGEFVLFSGGAAAGVHSFADSANPIRFNNAASFNFVGAAATSTSLLFNSRQIELRANGTINNNNSDAAKTITINTDLLVTTVGNKTLTLGGSNTGLNTFGGDIADAPGSVISLDKIQNGKWYLGGTNTYSGATSIKNAGNNAANPSTLTFQGIQALSPYTSLLLDDLSSHQVVLRVLDDGAGVINRTSVPVTFTSGQTGGAGTTNIFVGNNHTDNGGTSASTQANSTIALGGLTLNPGQSGMNGSNINITGANGYKLQLASIALPDLSAKPVASTYTLKLNPTTAAVIVAGDVTPFASANNNNSPVLNLDGTAAGNEIQGAIRNPANFGTSSALSVTKTSSSTWTLSGDNTYTGTTTVSGGSLIINGNSSVATGSVSVTNATLGGSGTIGGSVTVAATGNLSPGASAGTLSISGNLNISTLAAGAGKLNFELGAIGSSDKIAVTGTLDIGAGTLGLSDFNLSNLGGLQDGTYTLISSSGLSGSLNGADVDDVGIIFPGATIQLQTSGNNIVLAVSGLGGGTAYQTWATGNEPFDGDANGDGVKDGLAFLLGAANPSENATGRLPTVTQSGGNLVLSFNCLPIAARGTATLKVAHSTNLGSWMATSDVVPDANDPVPDNDVTFAVGAGPAGPPALNSVTATIGSAAAAGGGKLFGRLEATQP